MILLSLKFFLFFFAVFLFSFIKSPIVKVSIFLAASYYFYWTISPSYLILLIILTISDYIFGIYIEKSENKKRTLFVLALILNIGVLFFFKFFNFFNNTLNNVFDLFNIDYKLSPIKLLLPVGISYYIFKKISYLADIYRGTIKVEKNLIYFALYISFFPEIIAGPIDRAKTLIEQFKENKLPNFQMVTEGLQLIFWGLFKKLVIADRVAVFANSFFKSPDSFTGYYSTLGILFYSFQIYCDFSGYSDIAIGLGRILGIKFMDNFKQPYLSVSISEFWKKWHISLSFWLRDYVFLPVSYFAMNKLERIKKIKVEVWGYIIASLITMLICGIWHGSNWTFIVWGLLHGVVLSISLLTRKLRKKLVKFFRLKTYKRIRILIQIIFTFINVSVLWVFFRADTIGIAFDIFKNIFKKNSVISKAHSIGKMTMDNFYIAIIAIILLFLFEFILDKESIFDFLSKRRIWVRWSIYFFIIFSVLLFGIYDQTEFIYGQF